MYTKLNGLGGLPLMVTFGKRNPIKGAKEILTNYYTPSKPNNSQRPSSSWDSYNELERKAAQFIRGF